MIFEKFSKRNRFKSGAINSGLVFSFFGSGLGSLARFVPFRSLFLLPWLGPSSRLGSAYFARTQPRRRPRKASLCPSHHALPLGEPHFPRPAVGHGDCRASRNQGRDPSIPVILVHCIDLLILIPHQSICPSFLFSLAAYSFFFLWSGATELQQATRRSNSPNSDHQNQIAAIRNSITFLPPFPPLPPMSCDLHGRDRTSRP